VSATVNATEKHTPVISTRPHFNKRCEGMMQRVLLIKLVVRVCMLVSIRATSNILCVYVPCARAGVYMCACVAASSVTQPASATISIIIPRLEGVNSVILRYALVALIHERSTPQLVCYPSLHYLLPLWTLVSEYRLFLSFSFHHESGCKRVACLVASRCDQSTCISAHDTCRLRSVVVHHPSHSYWLCHCFTMLSCPVAAA